MNSELNAIILIVTLISRYGVAAAIDIIKTLSIKEITSGDIDSLADRVPHPSTYRE